jgi:hypothetical protein
MKSDESRQGACWLPHGAVLRFALLQHVHDGLLSLRFDADRQMPTVIREARTLEDSQSRFQPDAALGIWIFEQSMESLQRSVGQLAHLVSKGFNVFELGIHNGGFELGLVPEPMVDRGSVDSSFLGCGSDTEPLTQGGDDLSLNRRQVGICSRRGI